MRVNVIKKFIVALSALVILFPILHPIDKAIAQDASRCSYSFSTSNPVVGSPVSVSYSCPFSGVLNVNWIISGDWYYTDHYAVGNGTTSAPMPSTGTCGFNRSGYDHDCNPVGLALWMQASQNAYYLSEIALVRVGTISLPKNFSLAPNPTITGLSMVGSTLTANPGTWEYDTVQFRYQWQRDSIDIQGATSPTYSLSQADLAHQITVSVTGSYPGYASTTRTSASRNISSGFTDGTTPTLIYNFDTCGKLVGRTGPTQDQCASTILHYRDLVSQGFSVRDGIQNWVAPISATYNFEAAGAIGGGLNNEGHSAVINFNMYVKQGQKLAMLVGQQGLTLSYDASNPEVQRGGSGGGATYVTLDGAPLVVAAGSGGGGSNPYGFVETSATRYTTDANPPAVAWVDRNQWYGGTGAGFFANGNSYNLCTSNRATALVNGGQGGLGLGINGLDGGFGGGGEICLNQASASGGGWEAGFVPDMPYYLSSRGGKTYIDIQRGGAGLSYVNNAASAVALTPSGSGAGYVKISFQSKTFSQTPSPIILGATKVGSPLSADLTSWAAGANYSYQWFRDGVAISGATSANYRPTSNDLGKALAVQVTGTLAGYVTESRTSSPQLITASSDATLSATYIDGKSVQDGASVDLPAYSTSVDISTVTSDPSSWYEITGDNNLVAGLNTMQVIVTAPDRVTQRTYTYHLNVAPGDDATLSTFTVDGTSAQDGDTISLSTHTTSVDVVAMPTDPNASVQVTGATGLQTGDNTLTVTVTAADGTTTQVYTVDLNVLPSSNTGLSVFKVNGLDVSSGDTVSLDAAAASVDVTAVPADSNATVEITGDTDLSTGDNTLTVTVTAVDGSTQDYVVDLNVGLNSDTSLSSFQVNGVDVQDGDTVVMPYGTSAVDVFAQPSDLDASYEIIGDTGLQDGDNTLTIRVTAADGSQQDYNVTLSVVAGDDASLASLQINGQDAFNGDTLDLDPDTTSVDVVAIANDPNATVEITGDTDLVSGDNTLDITVTSSDGNTTQLYELDLRVATPAFEAIQPSVSGDGSVGGMLTVDPGDWGSGATYSYQWLRDGMPIKGQTSDSYVPGFFDYQHVLSVQVTGQAEGYDPVTVTSDSVTVTVGSLDDAISGNTCNNASLDSSNWVSTQGAAPSIVGAPLVSKTLSSTPGVWGKSLKYCRLWVENGQVVNNLSSGARYHTTSTDIDQVLQLVVVATDRQGNSTFRFSQPVTIQKLTFVKANAPVVAGNPRVKATLRAKFGPWARGVDYSYQWLRNGNPIDGANTITYKLTTDDKQTQISVQLCGHNDNYNDLCLTSNPTTIN